MTDTDTTAVTLDTLTTQIVLNLLWNHMHHRSWETWRVTRTHDRPNPPNPYRPRPSTSNFPAPGADTVTELLAEGQRILASLWPEEHPNLAHPLGVELTDTAYEAWLAQTTTPDAATLIAAIDTWPHAFEYKTNRHGTRKYRPIADADAIRIGLHLVPFATLRPLDPNDLEPGYISENDLAELERIAGVSTPPRKPMRIALALRAPTC